MPINNSIRGQNLLFDAYTVFKQPWTEGETTSASPYVRLSPSAWKEKNLAKKVTPPSTFNWVSFFSLIIPPSLPPFCSHVLNRKTDVWKLHKFLGISTHYTAINIAMIKWGGRCNFKRLLRVLFVIQWLERHIRSRYGIHIVTQWWRK